MKESIIVSKELESRIDRENVFGSERIGEINIAIESCGLLLKTSISSGKIDDNTVELEFLSKSDFAQNIFVNKNIKSVTIGEGTSNTLSIKNCVARSVSVIAKDDMYLCKIIIERS